MSDCLCFEKFQQFFKSCGTTYQQNWEMFSAFQSTSSPLTDGENSVQIHAQLATLSFLKLVQNWPKMRFWIWRSAAAPSDHHHHSGLVGDVAVPVSARQVVLSCAFLNPDARPRLSEWVNSCLTAHQHNTGYSVPLTVECWNDLY